MAGMTQGRRALLSVLQRTTAQFVAARCRVAPSRVSEWASGKSRPSAVSRSLLRAAYGIDESAWVTPSDRTRRYMTVRVTRHPRVT